jgi:hypothetical protein
VNAADLLRLASDYELRAESQREQWELRRGYEHERAAFGYSIVALVLRELAELEAEREAA